MKKRVKNKAIFYVYSIAAMLFIVTACLGISVMAVGVGNNGLIPDGVKVNGVALGGKTAEEAKVMVDAYISSLKEKRIIISVLADGEEVGKKELTLGQIGLDGSGDDIVKEVSEIGNTGNLIKRYKELKDARENGTEYNIDLTYDADKITGFVDELAVEYEKKAKNASLNRENGQFIITGGEIGKKLNKKASAEDIRAVVDSFIKGLPKSISDETKTELTLETTKPKYDRKALEAVTDVLGTYTTSYADSNAGRAQNVENGCRHVNGTLLLPGEEVSVNQKMYPYTVANGYGTGGAYLNGKVVSEVGGGICQVSTTLYNAVLYSELEVVQRQNHSMTVTYVPLARDAAIAGDWKDFVFKNNTEYPIYIEGVTENRHITFTVYGHETRDTAHRKIDFESVMIKKIAPGEDIVKEDDTKPEDYLEVEQGAWTGYVAKLYKNIYIDGALKEKLLINTSNYKAVPRHVIKGTKKVEEDKKGAKKKKDGSKKDKNNNDNTGDNDFDDPNDIDENTDDYGIEDDGAVDEGQ